jgi:hypothetical protein
VKRAIVIGAVVVAVLGALAIRVVIEGRNALADGDAWMLRGKTGEAIRAYESAARWYLPLAPHVDEAYDKLRHLAEPSFDAAPAGGPDPAVQLAAWRAIRSAARATRSFYQPHAEDLAAADAAIAKISAGVPQGGGGDIAWHQERLARESRPSTGMAALAGLGILLWIGGAIALVRRGIDPGGRLVKRAAGVAGIILTVGVGCWAVGLYNA